MERSQNFNSNNLPNSESFPHWIKQIQDGVALIDLNYANAIFSSKKNLYQMIINEGWELPDLDSKGCTVDYLLNVLQGKFFRIKKADIRKPSCILKKWPKVDLCAFLQTDILRDSIELGFKPEKLPNREFLENLLFTFSPNHEIFNAENQLQKVVELPVQ